MNSEDIKNVSFALNINSSEEFKRENNKKIDHFAKGLAPIVSLEEAGKEKIWEFETLDLLLSSKLITDVNNSKAFNVGQNSYSLKFSESKDKAIIIASMAIAMILIVVLYGHFVFSWTMSMFGMDYFSYYIFVPSLIICTFLFLANENFKRKMTKSFIDFREFLNNESSSEENMRKILEVIFDRNDYNTKDILFNYHKVMFVFMKACEDKEIREEKIKEFNNLIFDLTSNNNARYIIKSICRTGVFIVPILAANLHVLLNGQFSLVIPHIVSLCFGLLWVNGCRKQISDSASYFYYLTINSMKLSKIIKVKL